MTYGSLKVPNHAKFGPSVETQPEVVESFRAICLALDHGVSASCHARGVGVDGNGENGPMMARPPPANRGTPVEEDDRIGRVGGIRQGDAEAVQSGA